MGLCQNGEEEKHVNQSSTSELSCFMCWKNRVPSGGQADVCACPADPHPVLSTGTGQGNTCRCREEWGCLQEQVFSSLGFHSTSAWETPMWGQVAQGAQGSWDLNVRLPPLWATSGLSCPGSAVLVCHSLLPRGSGKERQNQLLVSPLACLPAPSASHLATSLLCQQDRQRGRLSLQKGQLHHWDNVGMQLEDAGEKSPCGCCFLQVAETSLSSGSLLCSGCYGLMPLTELNMLFSPLNSPSYY